MVIERNEIILEDRNKRYEVKYNNTILSEQERMTAIPYIIIKHYIENNKQEVTFEEFRNKFIDIKKIISVNGIMQFLLEEEKITNDSKSSRESNYIRQGRPLLEYKYNEEIIKFGVWTQWANDSNESNFAKFIAEINKFGYIIEECSMKIENNIKKEALEINIQDTREIFNNIVKRIIVKQNIKITDLGIHNGDLESKWFDMALLKNLPESCVGSKNGMSSNQSSIILTGKEFELFPVIRRNEFSGNIIGRHITIELPVKIMSNNLKYLKEEKYNSENTIIETYITTNEATQNRVEFGTKKVDGNEYKEFYNKLYKNCKLLVLKIKGKLEYVIFALREEDSSEYLEDLELTKALTYFDFQTRITNPEQVTFIKNDNIKIKEQMEGGAQKQIVSKKDYEVNFLIKSIRQYVLSKSFIYNYNDLSNFYLSLKTKPFAILAGISGTGKSKLVKLFARAVGATPENGQYNIINVKPDWNDSTELFGYKNINDEFIPGKLTEIIFIASKEENINKPYFICLDEMNLARVEYYLSEYLSIIESREFDEDNNIKTDRLFTGEYLAAGNKYANLRIPENIYIVGTVNMDDTTFAFSRKVLDRANTIEFSDVDLDALDFSNEECESINVDNGFFKTSFLNIKDALNSDDAFVRQTNSKVKDINEILEQGNKNFGYRVRDEIVFYMLENKINDLLSEDEAFDFQIMQKILPIITGSEFVIKDILIKLFNYCNTNGKEVTATVEYIKDCETELKSDKIKYKKSAEKILMMLRGYEDGFTSFWA
ncbi:MAG: energy-coupling factor transporter ATP-binding protein EcfA2 [Clostridium sp.]|jgi:energy-coupling factor transporter ATP-binding protein EcfA2